MRDHNNRSNDNRSHKRKRSLPKRKRVLPEESKDTDNRAQTSSIPKRTEQPFSEFSVFTFTPMMDAINEINYIGHPETNQAHRASDSDSVNSNQPVRLGNILNDWNKSSDEYSQEERYIPPMLTAAPKPKENVINISDEEDDPMVVEDSVQIIGHQLDSHGKRFYKVNERAVNNENRPPLDKWKDEQRIHDMSSPDLPDPIISYFLKTTNELFIRNYYLRKEIQAVNNMNEQL